MKNCIKNLIKVSLLVIITLSFFSCSTNNDNHSLKVWMCETDFNGDCVLYKYDDKLLLCDTGYNEVSLNSLKDALNHYNSNHIDYFIASHYHNDHIDNLDEIIEEKYIDENTIVYLPPIPDFSVTNERVSYAYNHVIETLNENDINYIIPKEFEELIINDFKLTFFNCEHQEYYDLMKNNQLVNDYNICSLCFKINYGNSSIVSTGDSGGILWKKYLNYIEKCTVYKAHHHSVDSSYTELLKDEYGISFFNKLHPDVVITSLGKYIAEADSNNDYYNRFVNNKFGLQQWCENNNVPNYVVGYKNNKNIELEITKDSYKVLSNSEYCIR